MRPLPEADPGMPDIRSPLRYLWWNARRQSRALLTGIAFATLWWLVQALMPAVLGKGDRRRHRAGHPRPGHLVGGPARPRRWCRRSPASCATGSPSSTGWSAAYRTVQVTARQAARLGATLPKRLSTGEVVSVGNSDIAHIGGAMDILRAAPARSWRSSR